VRQKRDPSPTPSDGEALLREVATTARRAATLVRELLGAADRVVAASEGAPPAPLEAAPAARRAPLALKPAREVAPERQELSALRLALNDLALARRALEPALNDVLEQGDRALDASGARTRHILR
jgi:hypothetical protein